MDEPLIEKLAAAVRAEFPDVTATIDGAPLHPDGAWWLDITVGQKQISAVWSTKRSFDLYLSESCGYGEGYDETFDTYDETWARLRAIIDAAKDQPDQLVRYERMLTFMGRANTPTDLDKTLMLYLFDRSYSRPDILKAESRVRLEKGWR